MIAWPPSLVTDLARRRAILFLGAGVSAACVNANGISPPGWETLLTRGAARCQARGRTIKGLIGRKDYLTACELIRNELDEDWGRFLAAEFEAPRFQPAAIHRSIFDIDARIVLTQNFDKIYDTFAQQTSNNSIVIKNYYDSDVCNVIREHKRVIIKAHGTIDAPNRMIFARSQYSKAQAEHPSFYDLVDALVLTHTCLFIGCGLADPDMQMFLTRHARRFPGSHPHWMCSPSREMSRDLDESLRDNFNLKILRYDPSENHRKLAESMSSLVELIANERDRIAREQDW